MEIVQILIILFGLFAFSRVILRFKDKEITMKEFLFWGVLWLVIIFFGFMPDITKIFAGLLGIGRGTDVAIYISIILLFYLIFRIYVKTENIEQEVTKIVREITLKKKK
ncbi:MAG: DUF2304 family protein [Candidatus Woesearchaeota archaeon]|nr:DUF2304 family protein [Candidatus Woesearchaeota archaeon]